MPLPRLLFETGLPRRTLFLRAVLLALLCAACALRVWIVFRYNPLDHLWSDAARHWQAGIRPLEASPMVAMDPIGYQLYLGALAKLTVGSPLLVAYWTSLLSLAGPWLWYRFLRELGLARDWALAGWVVLAALPSWSAIYSYFMQETLMLPLLGAALWATWRCRRRADVASFVLAVAVWLAAGLTRGICLPLGFVAMGWLWAGQSSKLPRAALSLAVVVAVLAPLAGRSWAIARVLSPQGIIQFAQIYLRAGTAAVEFDFTRRGGREHWNIAFVSPSMNHPPLAPLSNWPPRRDRKARFAIDLDAGNRDWDAAMESLPRRDVGQVGRRTLENLVHLMFGPSWPDSNIEHDHARLIGRVNYWMRWLWAPVAIACLAFGVARREQERERMLPALIVTWFVVQGLLPLAIAEGRYRKPFEGLLVAQCLLMASGLRRAHGAAPARVARPSATMAAAP
jgi:hypothetical protein